MKFLIEEINQEKINKLRRLFKSAKELEYAFNILSADSRGTNYKDTVYETYRLSAEIADNISSIISKIQGIPHIYDGYYSYLTQKENGEVGAKVPFDLERELDKIARTDIDTFDKIEQQIKQEFKAIKEFYTDVISLNITKNSIPSELDNTSEEIIKRLREIISDINKEN